jgi:hypothetical protein
MVLLKCRTVHRLRKQVDDIFGKLRDGRVTGSEGLRAGLGLGCRK